MLDRILTIFRKPAPAPAPVAPRYVCDEVHLPACRCFVDTSVKCIGVVNWRDCGCADCDEFRRARVRYWGWLKLERMYDAHCAQQDRYRKLMQSRDGTAVDPEIAHVTKVDPEIAIVTQVCEVA